MLLEVLGVSLAAVRGVDEHHGLRARLVRRVDDEVALSLELQLIALLQELQVQITIHRRLREQRCLMEGERWIDREVDR